MIDTFQAAQKLLKNHFLDHYLINDLKLLYLPLERNPFIVHKNH